MDESMRFKCTGEKQAHYLIANTLWPYIRAQVKEGNSMQIECKRETRTLAQNRLMWQLLNDIAVQVVWHGHKLSANDWKNMLTAMLTEQRVMPNIEGDGFVVIPEPTSKMPIPKMTQVIELAILFGEREGVEFKPFKKEFSEVFQKIGKDNKKKSPEEVVEWEETTARITDSK